ncbi:hypothetical protein [Zhihengliuella sp. ISTPL4]|uniref:hypothetical protein n=1 Tax=Zhihengliuella sp. ISTPL4 TaxID=2058657 RepID=UPI000C7E2561|nr:hypothetical protein [Zhihengliuella sp. ISTPL4]
MLPKTTGIVALALAASLALTGCAAGATPAADTSSKPAATVSPIPTRPTDPLEGKKSGDAIDAELAATINADWSGFADDRAYQMPSGE